MKRKTLLALVLVSGLLAPVAGQSPASVSKPAQPPSTAPQRDEDVVRITSNLVQVDVVVTDKKGQLVTGLKPEDFEIYEDGRLQPVTNFSFITLAPLTAPAENAASAPAAAAASPAPSISAARERPPVALPVPTVKLRREQVRRTIALVVDDLGISSENIHFVRRGLRKFVEEQMQPGDLVAIIRTGAGIGALQAFTSDKRLLYAAIDRIKWNAYGRAGLYSIPPIESHLLDDLRNRPANPDVDSDPQAKLGAYEQADKNTIKDYQQEVFAVGTLGALNYIIRGLQELPGRKSVIMFSDSIDLFDTQNNGNFRTVQALRRLTDSANRASVVIYTIDARGLPTLNLTPMDDTSGLAVMPNGAVVRANSGPSLMGKLTTRVKDQFESQDGLNYLALQTGGFFINNNNDIANGIERVLEDQKGYYLIGYRPDSATFNAVTGRRLFHRIEVKVKRPGLMARTRTGFFGVSNDEAQHPRRTPAGQLFYALTSPFASGDIDMRLTSIFLNDETYGAFVRSLIYVNPESLTFVDQPDGTKQASIGVLAMTFGDDGTPVDQRMRAETVRVRPDEYNAVMQQGLIFGINLPIRKPGAFQLRIAVRDAASERTGSANNFIEVPDLKKGRLTMSGLYLASRERAAVRTSSGTGAVVESVAAREDKATEGKLGEADPQSGPAIRRFQRGALIDYGFEVYNARVDKATRRPQLQSQVRLFRDNRLVFSGKVVNLNGQTDATSLVGFGRLQLGANLTPGEYVLQVIVTDALAKEKHRLATQWIDFEIK